MMNQRRSRRRRALPAYLKDFMLEHASSVEERAAAVRLDHSYSCISDASLEERHLRNAAVLPVLCPAASVSSVGECQQEEPLFIHGRSVQDYRHIHRNVTGSIMKKRGGRYKLQRGLEVKQRLWDELDRPALLETEQSDGRVVITEVRSCSRVAPQIMVDISGEPLPEEPRRKKPRH